MGECLAAVRDALGRTRGALLFLVQVLELLALRQLQHQIAFVGTRTQPARVRHHHFGVFETAGVVINHDVQQFAAGCLLAHIDMITAYLVVELTHRYIQFRAFLP